MRRRRTTARGLGLVATLVALATTAPAGAAVHHALSRAGRFTTTVNPFTVGQAPDWLDAGDVVYHARQPDGEIQIVRSTLAGRDRRCLTCGLAGPNQVPVVQPRGGRWILFHSWHGHRVRVGGPGFGGIGSDLWVMTRDGRRRTDLTPGGELRDDFHAYWAPDGRHVVWTALNWDAATGGTGRSDIRVARFEPDGPRGPRLVGAHAVRPGNGHWYETQWWAPDGSGFLYTETVDTSLDPELFFCRLPDADRGACRPLRLTRNPAWDEQAVFSPDMRRILFMSTRDHAGAFDNWSRLATLLRLPATYDYAVILPVFNEAFLRPTFQQANDLYDIALRWNRAHTRFRAGAARRLTRSGHAGWIVPEFAWDPAGRRLLWTESRLRDRVDEPAVLRRIRQGIVRRLAAIKGIADLPIDIADQVREQVGKVLADPGAFAPAGGGGGPSQLASRTIVGRYVRAR